MLKTAIAPVEYHRRSINARIRFDEGSHRSFIISELAKQLSLTAERGEIISLSTFGGTTTLVKRVEVSTIYLQTLQGETVSIEVFIIPKIAAPLQNFSTVDLHNLPHLKGLILAYPITDEHSFETDLLSGAC